MINRKTTITLGILFIIQIFTAAVGNSLVQLYIDGDTKQSALTIGVLLMMFSGLIIVAIGTLLYQVLRTTSQKLALWVLTIRIIECITALIFGAYLLSELQIVPNHLLWVYIMAGTAGVIFGYLLCISKLVPRPIAILGFIGYALILIGVPLDFAGVLDMNHGFGQIMIVPGGLFEILVLPTWLITKGFRSSNRVNISQSAGRLG